MVASISSSGGWSGQSLEIFLKVEPTKFDDGFDVVCEKTKSAQLITRICYKDLEGQSYIKQGGGTCELSGLSREVQ